MWITDFCQEYGPARCHVQSSLEVVSIATARVACPALSPPSRQTPADPCPCQEGNPGSAPLQPAAPAQAPLPGPADTPFTVSIRGGTTNKTSFPGSQTYKK